MEGHVVPYLKEVGLAGNLPGQLQGAYVRCCVFTCVRIIYLSQCHLSSAPRLQAYLDSRRVILLFASS